MSQTSQRGNIVKFSESACYILNNSHKLIAKAEKKSGLYYLEYNVVDKANVTCLLTNEDVWHRRFGHLGVRNLQKLARKELVKGYKFDTSQELTFCESCSHGKQHRTKFPTSVRRAEVPLGLVHSDLCGKMNEKSLSGAEYFLSFIDDKTHFTWVYFLKWKDEAFESLLSGKRGWRMKVV